MKTVLAFAILLTILKSCIAVETIMMIPGGENCRSEIAKWSLRESGIAPVSVTKSDVNDATVE